MAEPYHPFVFDETGRTFVGAFEEMYRAEDEQGFDSWCQDDLTGLRQRLCLALAGDKHESILDVGCGKGALTAELSLRASRTVAIDIAPTAIAKARERHPLIDFRITSGRLAGEFAGERFSLVTCFDALSYVERWRGLVDEMAKLGDRILVSLYLPPNPIGFVKSFDELRRAVADVAMIEVDLFEARHRLLLLLATT